MFGSGLPTCSRTWLIASQLLRHSAPWLEVQGGDSGARWQEVWWNPDLTSALSILRCPASSNIVMTCHDHNHPRVSRRILREIAILSKLEHENIAWEPRRRAYRKKAILNARSLRMIWTYLEITLFYLYNQSGNCQRWGTIFFKSSTELHCSASKVQVYDIASSPGGLDILGLVARCLVHAISPRLNHLKLRLRQATSIRFPGTFLGPTFRWMMRSDAFVNFCWARFDELYMVMEICDSDLKKLCRTDTRLQLGICTGMKIQP